MDNQQRPWKSLAAKRVKAIRDDTEQDCPDENYCAADVYRLACEVLALRKCVTAAARMLDDEADSLTKAGLSAGAAFAMSVRDVLRGHGS